MIKKYVFVLLAFSLSSVGAIKQEPQGKNYTNGKKNRHLKQENQQRARVQQKHECKKIDCPNQPEITDDFLRQMILLQILLNAPPMINQ